MTRPRQLRGGRILPATPSRCGSRRPSSSLGVSPRAASTNAPRASCRAKADREWQQVCSRPNHAPATRFTVQPSLRVRGDDVEAAEDHDSDEGEREGEHHDVLLSAAFEGPCCTSRPLSIASRRPPPRRARFPFRCGDVCSGARVRAGDGRRRPPLTNAAVQRGRTRLSPSNIRRVRRPWDRLTRTATRCGVPNTASDRGWLGAFTTRTLGAPTWAGLRSRGKKRHLAWALRAWPVRGRTSYRYAMSNERRSIHICLRWREAPRDPPRAPARRGGPVLVLLHDSLGSVGLWRDFPERLAEATGLEVLAYDWRGHGVSDPFGPRPRTSEYLHDEAATLARVLDELGVEDAVLFGHSDGSIALLAAAHHPRPIRAVVSEAAHVFVEERTLDGISGRRSARSRGAADLRASRSTTARRPRRSPPPGLGPGSPPGSAAGTSRRIAGSDARSSCCRASATSTGPRPRCMRFRAGRVGVVAPVAPPKPPPHTAPGGARGRAGRGRGFPRAADRAAMSAVAVPSRG